MGNERASCDEHRILSVLPEKGRDDFTIYLPTRADGCSQDIRSDIEKVQGLLPDNGDAYADTICLAGEKFRALICSCFEGKYYSLTFRRIGKRPKVVPGQAEPHEPSRKDFSSSGYNPKVRGSDSDKSSKDSFLFTTSQYCKVLFKCISSPKMTERSGLVVVAGSTSSGKSSILRGLIHEYLRQPGKEEKSGSRTPHLVTFEDPIETLCWETPEHAKKCGFDYTPRQKGKDCSGLGKALKECLRQTPSAVFVGETRNNKDWKLLVEFAGSGHLVLTTCHAGSLIQAVSAIRDGFGADTAAKRSVLATRLAAVVHLRPWTVKYQSIDRTAMLPALWLRTPAGINAFTCDGLGAILPHAFETRASAAYYCYGRAYFADYLLKTAKAKSAEEDNMEEKQRMLKNCGPELMRQALWWDLEGL